MLVTNRLCLVCLLLLSMGCSNLNHSPVQTPTNSQPIVKPIQPPETDPARPKLRRDTTTPVRRSIPDGEGLLG